MLTITSLLLVFIVLALTFINAYIQGVLGAIAAIRTVIVTIGTPIAAFFALFIQPLSALLQFIKPSGSSSSAKPPACTPTSVGASTPIGSSSAACSSSTTGLAGATQIPLLNEYLIYGLFVVLVLALILLLVLRLSRERKRDRTEDEFEETRERLPRGISRRAATPQPAVAMATCDLPAPNTVRAAYRELLRAGAVAGIPRESDETADKYGDRLAREAEISGMRASAEATRSLTRTYEDERYGEVQPNTGILARARAALRAIVSALRL